MSMVSLVVKPTSFARLQYTSKSYFSKCLRQIINQSCQWADQIRPEPNTNTA